MKVKVSKVFAAFINKAAKELGFKCSASVVTMGERAYRLNFGMDSLCHAMDNGDFNWTTGEYKAIRVDYPYGHYAMARYLTTAQLNREFARRGVRNEADLKEMLKDMCEI